MYQPLELARFAISEFERGLQGLTDEEARTRLTKADGSEMNAISWTVGHITGHWLLLAAYARQEEQPSGPVRFFGAAADPTPLPLSDALKLLDEAKTSIDWLSTADDELLSALREGHAVSRKQQESVGTVLMRVTLHTWFHTGEINAVRQMLGHAPIPFVGQMVGKLEWRGGQDGAEHS